MLALALSVVLSAALDPPRPGAELPPANDPPFDLARATARMVADDREWAESASEGAIMVGVVRPGEAWPLVWGLRAEAVTRFDGTRYLRVRPRG